MNNENKGAWGWERGDIQRSLWSGGVVSSLSHDLCMTVTTTQQIFAVKSRCTSGSVDWSSHASCLGGDRRWATMLPCRGDKKRCQGINLGSQYTRFNLKTPSSFSPSSAITEVREPGTNYLTSLCIRCTIRKTRQPQYFPNCRKVYEMNLSNI